MRKKILSLFSCLVLFISIFAIAALPASAAIIGASDYVPITPDMTAIFYVPDEVSPGRFTVFGLGTNKKPRYATTSYGNCSNTFYIDGGDGSNDDIFGYEFYLKYKAEVFLNFHYFVVNDSNAVVNYNINISLQSDVELISADFTKISISYFDQNLKPKVLNVNAPSSSLFSGYTLSFNDIIELAPDMMAISYLYVGFDYSNACKGNVNGRIYVDKYASLYVDSQELLNSSYALSRKALALGSGSDSEDVAYNLGWEDGYNSGYEDGENVGYNNGLVDGESSGYETGYSNGYNLGYSDGNIIGYDEGYLDGLDEGYLDGFDSGTEYGESVGYDKGFDDGLYNGYDQGVKESIEKMGLFEYIVKSIGSIFNIPLGEHFTLGGVLAIVVAIPILIAILKLFGG